MNLSTGILSVNPCQVCGYLFGDVHHIWPRSAGGSRFKTFVLCPNHHRYANIVQAMVMQGHPTHVIERFGRRYFQPKFQPFIRPLIAEQVRIMRALCMAVTIDDPTILRTPPLPQQEDLSDALDWDNLPIGPISLEHARTVGRYDEGDIPMSDAITATQIRHGDQVRLPDGSTATVTSTAGGYIFTTAGTYGPWQVERVDKWKETHEHK